MGQDLLGLAAEQDPLQALAAMRGHGNMVDNLGLNYASAASPGYAVFGKVVLGLDVVDLIRLVPTTTRTGDGAYQNIPATDVVIHSVAQTR